jgi:hypothetical protein
MLLKKLPKNSENNLSAKFKKSSNMQLAKNLEINSQTIFLPEFTTATGRRKEKIAGTDLLLEHFGRKLTSMTATTFLPSGGGKKRR